MSAERLSRKYHHSPRPPLVESESRQQISLCQVENAQLHATRVAFRRSLRLATCQSENSALSSRTSRSVSRRATPCRPGEATSASSRLRSAQSASIARSLSSRDMRLIANVIPTSIIWSIKCPPARPNRRRECAPAGTTTFQFSLTVRPVLRKFGEGVLPSRAAVRCSALSQAAVS